MFAAKPNSSDAWRVGRLLAAVTLYYLVLVLVLHLQSWLEWSEAYAFRNQSLEYRPQPCEGGPRPKIDGAFNGIATGFGWASAIVYAGFWELVWRIWYRKEVNALPQDDRGTAFRRVFIIISQVFFWLPYIFLAREIGKIDGLLQLMKFIFVL